MGTAKVPNAAGFGCACIPILLVLRELLRQGMHVLLVLGYPHLCSDDA